MSATSADMLAFISSSDAAMAPNSSRPWASMRRDRSPSRIARTPACSGRSDRARVRCSDTLSATAAAPSATQATATTDAPSSCTSRTPAHSASATQVTSSKAMRRRTELPSETLNLSIPDPFRGRMNRHCS